MLGTASTTVPGQGTSPALWSVVVQGEDSVEPAVPLVMYACEMYRILWEPVRKDLPWSASQKSLP